MEAKEYDYSRFTGKKSGDHSYIVFGVFFA